MQQPGSQPSPPGCPHCGHSNPPLARFCGHCGQALHQQAQLALALPQNPEPLISPTRGSEEEQKATEAEAEGDDDDSPIAALQEHKLRLGGAPRPLRIIMWVLIGQMILVGLLLLTQNLPQPVLDSGVPDIMGGNYSATLAIFVVLTLSQLLAYWFLLAGALRAHWYVGLLIVALMIYLLANLPLGYIQRGAGEWEYWVQLGLLALLGLWELGVMVWQLTSRSVRTSSTRPGSTTIRGQPSGPAQSAQPPSDDGRSHLLRGGGLLGALAILLGYYGLELASWASTAWSINVGVANKSLLSGLGSQVELLTVLLPLVLLLGSTDMLEWGEIVVTCGWRLLKLTRAPWRLWAITLVAALATIAKVWLALGSGLLFSLLVVAVLTLLLWGLARLVPLAGGWSKDLRGPAVQIGAVLIFTYLVLLSQITNGFALTWGLLMDNFPSLFYPVGLPVGLAALAIGLFALLRSQRRNALHQALCFFAVLVLALLVVANLALFLNTLKLGAFFPVKDLQSVLQLSAGLAVLIWVVGMAIRGQVAGAGDWLGNALQLLIGLQLVFWVQNLLDFISALQSGPTLYNRLFSVIPPTFRSFNWRKDRFFRRVVPRGIK
jgi:hypothetical protein